MCVPKAPKPQGAAPSAIPSLASAQGFQAGPDSPLAGNSSRGAAVLGRLKLRIGGGPSPQGKTTSGAPSQAPPAGFPTSTAYSQPNQPGGEFSPGGFSFRGFDVNAL